MSAEQTVEGLARELSSYLDSSRVNQVRRAYYYAEQAHEGQKRRSGEPYVTHPLAVASILADLRLDHQSLMAAMLHDVIEDTGIPKEALSDQFGESVADLVDGVSKLTQIEFRSRAEAQAENFQKMTLAMARDIRVILVKLADRLHNMRTLGPLPFAKRQRIATETLDIYAPIANRLGMHSICTELEDLGFSSLYPMRSRYISKAVAKLRGSHQEIIQEIRGRLEEKLAERGLPGRIMGREKHLNSIYNKMKEQHKPFSDIMDVFGFRIIVDRVDTCYRVLGATHNYFTPIPGRFKDYIAIPKANGYQSLHTVLFGPHGIPIEIQIRTEEMHRLAESGIAAHWIYKSGDDQSSHAQAGAADWLKNLLEFQQGAGDSLEFLEHVKVDLFPDEVYVFTPRGKIMVLAKGATVIDFAYAVHSDVGNQCVAARVDRRMVPLRSRLYSGQTVEVITSPTGRPSPAWLNFVVTGKARANIRNYLKNLKRREAIELGERMLDKRLSSYGISLEQIEPLRLNKLLQDFNLSSTDKLLEEIGLGNRMPLLVARRLLESEEGEGDEKEADIQISSETLPLVIKGTEGMVVSFAKCCRPLPGDEIVAAFSPGKGIVVHRHECRNIGDFKKSADNWLDVEWEADPGNDFSSEIKVDVGNKSGVLATVAAAISETGSNIENVSMKERDGLTSTLQFVMSVRNRRHLANIMRRLRSLPAVLKISRM